MLVPHELLKNVPDFESFEQAKEWIFEGEKIFSLCRHEEVAGLEFASLEWKEISEKPINPFGYYGVKNWRKFLLVTFLADLVSYRTPVDQVNFERLAFVMHTYPEGFRTWWIYFKKWGWWPAGYSGWYPMHQTQFELFEKRPEMIKDRTVIPNNHQNERNPYLYLFNFSVAPPLKKTSLSKGLMKAMVEDVKRERPQGLACITVSQEGVNVAEKFGMRCSGYFLIEGVKEGVYIVHANQ